MTERTCATSGLRLTEARPGDSGFRVSKFPPLSSPERSFGDNVDDWSRYDIVGHTLYVAENPVTAYAEVLAPYKRSLGAHDSLSADAAAIGMTVSDFVEAVATEWGDRGFMGLGAMPAVWRHLRSIYEILLPTHGWWIDIEHPDSIAALSKELERELAALEVRSLTTATLRGDDRTVTAILAKWLAETTLDDGSKPLGVHFGSKHGGAWCKAVWTGDARTALTALSGEPVLLADKALRLAADRFQIRVF